MKKLVFCLLLAFPLISFAQEIKIIRPHRVFRFENRISIDRYQEPRNSFSIFPNSVSRSISRIVDRVFDCDQHHRNYYGTIWNRNGMEIIVRPRIEITREINREIIERIRTNIRKARGVRI